jgi:hypothetical protein
MSAMTTPLSERSFLAVWMRGSSRDIGGRPPSRPRARAAVSPAFVCAPGLAASSPRWASAAKTAQLPIAMRYPSFTITSTITASVAQEPEPSGVMTNCKVRSGSLRLPVALQDFLPCPVGIYGRGRATAFDWRGREAFGDIFLTRSSVIRIWACPLCFWTNGHQVGTGFLAFFRVYNQHAEESGYRAGVINDPK